MPGGENNVAEFLVYVTKATEFGVKSRSRHLVITQIRSNISRLVSEIGPVRPMDGAEHDQVVKIHIFHAHQ